MNPRAEVKRTEDVSDHNLGAILANHQWKNCNITYSFPKSINDYDDSTPKEYQISFLPVPKLIEKIVPGILDEFSAVCGLRFSEEKDNPGEAILRFARYTPDNNVMATAFLPGEAEACGDVWLNRNMFWGSNVNEPGSQCREAMYHEILHAVGGKHGHEAGADERGPMTFDRDSIQYTVMTYRGGIGGIPAEFGYHYPQTLMMYDIAALQAMYGANYDTRSGDTNYKWFSHTGDTEIDGIAEVKPGFNVIFLTIWDGGGHDVYDFSDFKSDLRVDLRPGAYSTISQEQLAHIDMNGQKALGNVYNALLHDNDPRSLIEDAIGGGGDDHIKGNRAGNVLEGREGDDRIWGYEGADRLEGGPGDDQLFGGEENDALRGGPGNDRLYGEPGMDHLCGEDGDDVLNGGEGDDMLEGGAGKDKLAGDAGHDILNGGDDDDILDGGDGEDILIGGPGNDVLTGGKGKDTFVLTPDGGVDTIIDFNPRAGGGEPDRIDLRAFGFRKDQVEQILAAAEREERSILLDLDGETKTRLIGVDPSGLSDADFMTV